VTAVDGAPTGNRRSDDHLAEVPISPPLAPDVVSEIGAIARAGRAIVRRFDLSLKEKHRAIVELGFRARATVWPFAAQNALWRAVAEFLGEAPPGPDTSPDPVIRPIRLLLEHGFTRCPRCQRPLPDERELDRVRLLADAAVDEARRREAALDA
jgi:hypothetical protein